VLADAPRRDDPIANLLSPPVQTQPTGDAAPQPDEAEETPSEDGDPIADLLGRLGGAQ
jgi:penicillin-binding protein 1A